MITTVSSQKPQMRRSNTVAQLPTHQLRAHSVLAPGLYGAGPYDPHQVGPAPPQHPIHLPGMSPLNSPISYIQNSKFQSPAVVQNRRVSQLTNLSNPNPNYTINSAGGLQNGSIAPSENNMGPGPIKLSAQITNNLATVPASNMDVVSNDGGRSRMEIRRASQMTDVVLENARKNSDPNLLNKNSNRQQKRGSMQNTAQNQNSSMSNGFSALCLFATIALILTVIIIVTGRMILSAADMESINTNRCGAGGNQDYRHCSTGSKHHAGI